VDLESRGIHGDQRVRGIARREDVVARESELKSRNARRCAGRRADFGGIVGKGGDVVAGQRGVARVISVPVSCIPSPESPTNPNDGVVDHFRLSDFTRKLDVNFSRCKAIDRIVGDVI
jgi:hypothetical protein